MSKKKGAYNNKTKERGITLVTLVITVIVLLILAGISLNGIFGESGLINKAQEAKENAEIAEEMELIQQAVIKALAKSKTGAITVAEMKNAINNVTSDNNLIVLDNENTVVVKFNNSNRHYEIDRDGNADGPKELINDKYAGDLSKGGKNTGEEDKPYVINCIEDLVVFSRDYATYESSYVILARTLDFKSVFSYNDCTSKEYGDLNGDGIEEDIKTELTKQGDACGGFTPIASFKGTFDGQNNKICNLYENRGENNAGLFDLNSGTIKNLGLEKITLTGGTRIGGIVAKAAANCTILNCYVEGTSIIKGTGGYVGLIIGGEMYQWTIIEDCYSIGKVNIDLEGGTFAGVVGCLRGGIARRCYNVMDIESSTVGIGGIVGEAQGASTIIEECYHIGNITQGAGVVNGTIGNAIIKNCYNIGEVGSCSTAAGITRGGIWGNCFNCYSIGKITSTYCGGIINGMNYGGHIVNCFGRRGDFKTLPDGELTESQILSNLSSYNNNNGYGHKEKAVMGYKCNVLTDEELKTQDFVDELNTLIEADSEGVITETEQNVWKMDTEGINNGYPIFTWQDENITE